MALKQIDHGTKEYQQMVKLRNEILRKPLGLSFTPEELTSEIQKIIPNFSISYMPDFRQEIAKSWPQIIDDKEAREDWAWIPNFTLSEITQTMILKLKDKLIFA